MKKINVGLIGLGVGYYHAVNIKNHKFYNLKMICDIDEKKIKKFKNEFCGVKFTTNVKDIFQDDDIKLVCIASYDKDHFDHVISSLKNNKHVFVEKPVCKNYKEYLQIKKLLEKKKNLEISSNFVLRGHSSVNKIKRLIDQNKLGKIYYLEADYNYGRIKKIIHGWRSRELNYSVFLGGGIHMFDLIMYFLKNKKILSYQKINNKIATISTSYKYDDFDLLTLKFDDNCIAKITSNFACVFPHSHFFKIYGTNGTFFFDHECEIYAKNINGRICVKKRKITNVNANKKLALLSFLDFLCNKKKIPLISKKNLLKITNDSLLINEGKKLQ